MMNVIPLETIRPAGSDFRFQVTEDQIAAKLNMAMPHPIRAFRLDGLGVDGDVLLRDLNSSFEGLSWDFYDVKNEQIRFLIDRFPESAETLTHYVQECHGKGLSPVDSPFLKSFLSEGMMNQFLSIKPNRRRAIATFMLEKDIFWSVNRIPTGSFQQKKNPFNPDVRHFQEIDGRVTSHPEFQKLLQSLAVIISTLKPKARRLKAHCHQVSIVATPGREGQNAPEGIHQDGADYIVSAIVMAREGVEGGISTVYGPDQKTAYLTYCLQPGEGLFQADEGSPLYHHVSGVKAIGGYPGSVHRRNIIGFDFTIEE